LYTERTVGNARQKNKDIAEALYDARALDYFITVEYDLYDYSDVDIPFFDQDEHEFFYMV
jgi:hypothetical protein